MSYRRLAPLLASLALTAACGSDSTAASGDGTDGGAEDGTSADGEGDSATPVSGSPLSVDRLEWEHIQRVLAEQQGNISATARALKMHRRTLQRKLGKRPTRE